MPFTKRFPSAYRLVVGAAGALLAVALSTTLAYAQQSQPVETQPLTVNDSDGVLSPGQSVTVSGQGFAPGATVDVTIESAPVHLATVQAAATGAFTATVQIPANFPAGSHTLKATGAAPNGGLLVLSSPVTIAGATGGTALAFTGRTLVPLAVGGCVAVVAGFVLMLARRRVRTA